MKFYETHFEEYINEESRISLHPKLDKIYKCFPSQLCEMPNIIFYGPSGTGKYTQMLKAIKKYSPTELKYEKKISITYNKQQYFFKISDIHYEIDISLLGCNSKLLWHEIYQQIIDIISTKSEKSGIIVCKYFHEIHNELLENFYSYMQKNFAFAIDLKFIILTEQISFIPSSIVNCCKRINIARPLKNLYSKCMKINKFPTNLNLKNITNIKILNIYDEDLMLRYKIICKKILYNILNIHELHFLNFREILYDIFIYNLCINDCIWYILSILVEQNKIQLKDISKILIKTYTFFQYYNNNYRPIYHVENYFLFLTQIVHNIN